MNTTLPSQLAFRPTRPCAALRAVGVLFLLALALVGWAKPSAACSCARLPRLESVRSTPAIFEARILEARAMDASGSTIEVIVEPTDIWKGAVPRRAVLRSAGEVMGCGVFNRQLPSVGETFLASAWSIDEDGVFSLSSCTFFGSSAALAALRGPTSERRRLDAAVEAAPGSLAPIFERARSRESWDPDGAAAAYAALARDHPELAAAHLGLGRTLRNTPRVAEAVRPLQQAASLNPSDPEAPALLAQARFRLGDTTALDGLRHFAGIRLDGLDITRRDLRGANFTDAVIGGLRAYQANLHGATFRNASFPAGATHLQEADLRRADLTGLDAGSINFDGARLDGARLDRASLDYARLRGATLRQATGAAVRLGNADMSRANLAGAKLPDAAMRYAKLADADLRNADLRGADLRATDLRGADLRGANLAGANLGAAFHDCRTRLPRGFDPEAQEMIVPSGACQPR